MENLEDLLSSLPGYASISAGMKTSALNGALVPDANGVWPGQVDYMPTHDVYFAALSLLGFLQALPMVTSTSSEGTSVSVSRPDWSALIAFYRSQSPIACATSGGVLNRITIPEVPYIQRTDMSGRGTAYGDIDTDIN